MANVVDLPLTREETGKLLDLVGHDIQQLLQMEDLRELVRGLYRTLKAYGDGSTTLGLPLNEAQAFCLHAAVTLYAFGEGGKEFREKLGQAFLDLDHVEDLPEFDVVAVDDGMSDQLRLSLQEFNNRRNEDGDGSPNQNAR